MSRLLRLFCVCLGVTVVVALQAHGAISTKHRIEHGLQYPGVSYAETASFDHGHDHDHDQVEPAPVSDGFAVDADNGDAPVTHHHHGGGDVHLALAAPMHPLEAGHPGSLTLGPVPDSVPPGYSRDGPSHPPKQLRLIA